MDISWGKRAKFLKIMKWMRNKQQAVINMEKEKCDYISKTIS